MSKFVEFFKNLYLNNELLKAITDSNLARVKELLDNGADVNGNLLPNWNPFALAFTYWRRYSPLHCALGRSSYDVIEELVNRSANINEIHYWFTFNNIFSYTTATTMELALVRFSRNDQDRVMQLFLKNGFDIASHGTFLSSNNALEAIDAYAYENDINDEATLKTKSIKQAIQNDFKSKKELLDQIESNPDNTAFTKKQSVPSLFFLSAKKAVDSGKLEKLPNKQEIPPDIINRMQEVEKNAVIYSKLKPQVEAYESRFT